MNLPGFYAEPVCRKRFLLVVAKLMRVRPAAGNLDSDGMERFGLFIHLIYRLDSSRS
jgi:hypothetical protein